MLSKNCYTQKTITLVVAISVLLIQGVSASCAESFEVIGCAGKEQGLLRVRVTIQGDGLKAELIQTLPLDFRPSSIAKRPNGNQIVVSSTSVEGSIPVVVVAKESEGLKVVSESRLSHPTGYTSFDRSGKFFLFANYKTGTIGSYRVDPNGSFSEPACVIETPNKEAHCILTSQDNRFVYIPCVKYNNALFQYEFDDASGMLSPLTPIDAEPPAMFGPRHVAYHPTLPLAYFSNEQQLGVSVFEKVANGQLTAIQHATSMARRSPYEKGKRGIHASDIAITSDAKWLFIGVRDFVADEDSVFSFRVESDGRLSKVARKIVGDIPWKIGLSPDDSHLVVSEAGDRRLSFFRIGAEGQLSKTASVDWDAYVRDMVVISP